MAHAEKSLDGLLRRAAAVAPGRTAIRSGDRETSYCELDAAADGFAAALAGLPHRTVVGVVAAPHPAFPIAYYGAVRAGHICAVVDPVLPDDELEHVLGRAGVTVLVTTGELAGRLERVRLALPGLTEVLFLDRPGGHGARTVASLARTAAAPPGPPFHPDAVACLRFAGGTAIPLTHRNLLAAATQAARVYGFGPGSTVVHHLPAYEQVYLNAAVRATATQVLCADPDPAGGVVLAGVAGATHLCGQPIGLTRLAADPRPTHPPTPTVRAVISRGSVITPATATRLTSRVGAPLVQWYGPAAAPLTHCDRLDRPTAGSVGRPVLGTECRVMELDGPYPAARGKPGQVRVRGPQVASGAADPDGWLSTGDVGYLNADGALFLVGQAGGVR